MKKSIVFSIILTFLLIATLGLVSAYDHATYRLSDSLTFREDVTGSDRSFTLTQSTDTSRKTVYGYYDWSAHPKNLVYYPDESEYRLSQNTINQAFRTFQQDSQAQNRLEQKHLDLHHRTYSGYYGGYRYHGRIHHATVYRYGF